MSTDKFAFEAANIVEGKIEELRSLSFREAMEFPEAESQDIVVAGNEAQLTIFRQLDPAGLEDSVLITIQVARPRMRGIYSEHYEGGLWFTADGVVREATESELWSTGG